MSSKLQIFFFPIIVNDSNSAWFISLVVARGFAAHKLPEVFARDVDTVTCRSSGKPLSRKWLKTGRIAGRSIPSACTQLPGCPAVVTQLDGPLFSQPVWQFPHSLVNWESFSRNHVDGSTRDPSTKSYDFCYPVSTAQPQRHSGRWERRKQFSQRAGKTATIKSKVNLRGVVTCCITPKVFMRIQHNPQQIFLEDLWINPHQHKHGMTLQWCLCHVQQELLKTPKELPQQHFCQIAAFLTECSIQMHGHVLANIWSSRKN